MQVKGRKKLQKKIERTNQSDGARYRKVFHSVTKRIFESEAVGLKKKDDANGDDGDDNDTHREKERH
jgi:hypothetical protein